MVPKLQLCSLIDKLFEINNKQTWASRRPLPRLKINDFPCDFSNSAY